MIDVKVEGMREAINELGDLRRKATSIIARTLTEAAREGKKNVEGWIPRLIDRPTPWTKNSLKLVDAKKDKLRAGVLYKVARGRGEQSDIDSASSPQPMVTQTYGTPRKMKQSEKTLLSRGVTTIAKPYLIPTKYAPKDRYGNVTGGTMNKVLYSGVKNGSATKGVPMAARTLQSARKGQYFVLRGADGDGVGIAQNMGPGNAPRMMFMFGKTPVYKSRVPFDKMVETVALRVMDKKFQESVDVVIAKYGYWK